MSLKIGISQIMETGKRLIKRGDIFWVNLDPTVGTEIHKIRPAIVVSNDAQNKSASRIIVIPLNSNIKQIFSFHVKLLVKGKISKALVDQIRIIDKSRIDKMIGCCSYEEMKQIDITLKKVLNLD